MGSSTIYEIVHLVKYSNAICTLTTAERESTVKQLVKNLIKSSFHSFGLEVLRRNVKDDNDQQLVVGWPPVCEPPPDYNHDALAVWHKDVSFLRDPAFVRAYQAGMNSGHKICREKGSDVDIHIEWRVYVACWAAWHAKQLPGSFVECGVNTGIYSLAVCNYIDFNSTGKDFFLFDTFKGIPEEQMTEQERDNRIRENQELYEECYDVARRNFAPFPKAKLVRGKVPDTLNRVSIDKVCYLSIDMNIAEPEIAAIEFFWDKLVCGAPVLLDDYGWVYYSLQKEEMDSFASKKGVKILTMPTGQGLLIKP